MPTLGVDANLGLGEVSGIYLIATAYLSASSLVLQIDLQRAVD